MPVAFDFIGPSPTFRSAVTTISFTDADNAGGSQNVKFTLSSNPTNGPQSVGLGFSGLTIDDNGGGGTDTWLLTFQDTANTANKVLTGTALNPIRMRVDELNGGVRYTVLSSRGSLDTGTITSTGTFRLTDMGPLVGITSIRFATSGTIGNRIVIDQLTANALNCFLAGTQIATPEGTVAVEDIEKGDCVQTADGRVVTVRWLGQQFVDTRVTHPAKVNPICISAGTLAEGVPERDLYVSPDHAIEVDGMLINAGALVNGHSIFQVPDMPLDGFTYYHIETDAHELLLAEGVAAESFLDYSDTFGFDNAKERSQRVIPEMALPRISSARLVPDTVRHELRERAQEVRPVALAG